MKLTCLLCSKDDSLKNEENDESKKNKAGNEENTEETAKVSIPLLFWWCRPVK